MKREIKFRGKRLKDDIWVYGLLTNDMKGHYRINFDPKSFSCVVKENTICQFTGLKDKNGREIYECDILRSVVNPDIIMYVSYDVEEASFMAIQINKYTGTDLESRCHIRREWITGFPKEVIGNIYDNPELIKREE